MKLNKLKMRVLFSPSQIFDILPLILSKMNGKSIISSAI